MNNADGSASRLDVQGREFGMFRLDAAGGGFDTLPYSLKILLENLLRHEDGANVTRADVEALANWDPAAEPSTEIVFTRRGCSCRTSPACRRWSISRRCATRSAPSAATRIG